MDDGAYLGRSTDGLFFYDLDRGRVYVSVRLRGDNLEASIRLWAHYATTFDDLTAYLDDLAENWRGWTGSRVWESLEHELRLSATHDGHVHLSITMRQSSLPDGWDIKAVVTLDPGEELSNAASDIRAFLASA